MRIVSIVAALAAALALAAFDSPRAAGAYSSLPAENSESCARLCTADTLCMSWTYAENLCALRANVPQNMSPVSGLSSRAPQAMRQAINIGPSDPIPAAPAVLPTPPPSPRAAEPVETALLLLGGPDEALDATVRR